MRILSEEKLHKALNAAYDLALRGLPASPNVEALAAEYLARPGTIDEQVAQLIRWQSAKCAASGFLTGLGGLITLPVALPADLSANLYVQLRMVAAVARMYGHDPGSDLVRTMAFVCLCGAGASEVVKDLGIQLGTRLAANAVQRLSAETLAQVNQRVGFRLLARIGESGGVNLGRAVPLVGGLVGAAFGGATCQAIGAASRKVFRPHEP
jgi:uncharacterized membrane protein YcjF (UPF0283 family)